MKIKLKIFLTIVLLMMFSAVSHATNNDQQLDDIYRVFFNPKITLSDVIPLYSESIIHVNQPQKPLLIGKDAFIKTNIAPLMQMIHTGELSFTAKTFIVRRVIKGDMANDVGYLYSKIKMSDGNVIEQLQKFSWVFVKENGRWLVITDFDVTQAPLETLDTLKPERVIE